MTFIIFLFVIFLSYAIVLTHKNQNYQIHYTALLDIKYKIKDKNYDTIFVGDSALLRGLNAKLFSKLYGKDVYNMGTYANSGNEILINSYLKKNNKPKNIIIYFSPRSPFLQSKPSFAKTYTVLKYGSYYEIVNKISLREIIRAAKVLLTMYFDSVFGFNHFSYKNLEKTIDSGNGFEYTEKKAIPNNRVYNGLSNERFNMQYLLDQKDYYNSLGINTVLYVAPVTYYEEGFDYFRDKYVDITVNKLYKLPNKYFEGQDHLTKEGADLNTYIVFNELKNYLTKKN